MKFHIALRKKVLVSVGKEAILMVRLMGETPKDGGVDYQESDSPRRERPPLRW